MSGTLFFDRAENQGSKGGFANATNTSQHDSSGTRPGQPGIDLLNIFLAWQNRFGVRGRRHRLDTAKSGLVMYHQRLRWRKLECRYVDEDWLCRGGGCGCFGLPCRKEQGNQLKKAKNNSQGCKDRGKQSRQRA